jgi:hypothetical protein
MMRGLAAAGLGLAAAAVPLAAQRANKAEALLVVAPDVAESHDEALARLAQRLTARLLQALEGAKVAAVRTERGRLDSLLRAKAPKLALDASLSGEAGRRSAQLRLIDVATGDELRAYMFGPGDDEGVLGLADRAAPRIAAAVQETSR